MFLAPAVIIYTLVMILPLAETLRLSFFNKDAASAEIFVGLQNFTQLFFDERWSGQFWNALWNNLYFFFIHMLVQNPIGVAAGGDPVDGASARAHLLPHRHLHSDHALGGHHRLHLEADPEPDLGRVVARCWVRSG